MARRKKKLTEKPDQGPAKAGANKLAQPEKERRAVWRDSPSTSHMAIQPLSTLDTLAFALALLIAAIIYIYTMWPTVAGGDSGELIAAVHSLGVIHPPGYPLYTMLAHLMTHLPIGSVAWRVNLFSLICGLGVFTLFVQFCRRFVPQLWICLAAGLTLMFSPLMWRYSIVAEVFTLHALLSFATFTLTVKAVQEQRPKLAILISLLVGFGVSHHHTYIFVALGCAIFLLWHLRGKVFQPKLLLSCLAAVGIGLTPYLYLVWSSTQVPLIAWGDQSTWDGFWTHFFRREYGTFQLASEGTQRLQLFWGLIYYLKNFAQHLGYIGFPVALFGAYVNIKRGHPNRSVLILAIGISLSYLVIFHTLANLPFVEGAAIYKDIVARFWLMPHTLLFFLFALGARDLFNLLDQRKMGSIRTWTMALFALPLLLLVLNFRNENHRDDTVFAEFGKRMLAPVPQNGVFFTIGDINTNSIRYLQTCENYRPDIRVIDRSLMSYLWFKRIARKHFPDVVLPGSQYHPQSAGAYDFKRLFDTNFDKHALFVNVLKTKGSNEALDHAWEKEYYIMPFGLSYRVLRVRDSFDFDAYISESQRFLVDPLAAFPKEPLIDSWDAVVQANYWLAHHLRSAEILKFGIKTQERKYIEMATQLLEDLVMRNKHPSADYFKNLGVAHQHMMRFTTGDERAQHERRMLEVWEEFLKKTDRHDKTVDDIRSVLRAYNR